MDKKVHIGVFLFYTNNLQQVLANNFSCWLRDFPSFRLTAPL